MLLLMVLTHGGTSRQPIWWDGPSSDSFHWGFCFHRPVWTSWFDISRAIAPIITAYALLLVVARQSEAGVHDPSLARHSGQRG